MKTPLSLCLATLGLFVQTAVAEPLSSQLSYQGGLSHGGLPANGTYDLRLAVFDAQEAGFAVMICASRCSTPRKLGLLSRPP